MTEEVPIDEYDRKNVGDVEDAVSPYGNGISELSDSDVVGRYDLLREVLEYERANKDRKTAKGHIEDVLEDVEAEVKERDLLDVDEEADSSESSDGEEDDTEEEESEAEESEPEDEADTAVSDDGEDEEDEDPTFQGNDGKQRILVRNHTRQPKNVAGYQFQAGEVKDMVANDRILSAVRRNELQVVKG